MSDLAVRPTATGGYAVTVPADAHGGQTIYEWHAERGVWRCGTTHRDDPGEPACTEPCGITERPGDEQEAAEIVGRWVGES